jgi:hypothetical protein
LPECGNRAAHGNLYCLIRRAELLAY